MNDTVPTERPDIIDRLNDLLDRGVSAPADAVIADAITEIQTLRGFHDDIDQLDMHGLRNLTARIQQRIDVLILEGDQEAGRQRRREAQS